MPPLPENRGEISSNPTKAQTMTRLRRLELKNEHARMIAWARDTRKNSLRWHPYPGFFQGENLPGYNGLEAIYRKDLFVFLRKAAEIRALLAR
jgi:hypothetical protein